MVPVYADLLYRPVFKQVLINVLLGGKPKIKAVAREGFYSRITALIIPCIRQNIRVLAVVVQLGYIDELLVFDSPARAPLLIHERDD